MKTTELTIPELEPLQFTNTEDMDTLQNEMNAQVAQWCQDLDPAYTEMIQFTLPQTFTPPMLQAFVTAHHRVLCTNLYLRMASCKMRQDDKDLFISAITPMLASQLEEIREAVLNII